MREGGVVGLHWVCYIIWYYIILYCIMLYLFPHLWFLLVCFSYTQRKGIRLLSRKIVDVDFVFCLLTESIWDWGESNGGGLFDWCGPLAHKDEMGRWNNLSCLLTAEFEAAHALPLCLPSHWNHSLVSFQESLLIFFFLIYFPKFYPFKCLKNYIDFGKNCLFLFYRF